MVLAALTIFALAAIATAGPLLGYLHPRAAAYPSGLLERPPGPMVAPRWHGLHGIPPLLLAAVILVAGFADVALTDGHPRAGGVTPVVQTQTDVQGHLAAADRYLRGGSLRAAADELLSVLAVDAYDPRANSEMALVLYLWHRPAAALRTVDRVLERDPNDPRASLIRGLILLRGALRPRAAVGPLTVALRGGVGGSDRKLAERLLREATSPDRTGRSRATDGPRPARRSRGRLRVE
jgi:hypothetical protein